MKTWYGCMAALALAVAVAGCGAKKVAPLSPEDNPAHHCLMGMELLEKNKLAGAEASFARALALEPECGPALAGSALARAMKEADERDPEFQAIEVERIDELMEDACSAARDRAEHFTVYVTGIRVYSSLKPGGWLKKAVAYYGRAADIKLGPSEEPLYYRCQEAAHYFMAEAYLKALDLPEAGTAAAKVLGGKPGKWHEPATVLYKRMQKIGEAKLQATSGDTGKKIAVKGEISRSDVAALLIDELKLDRLFTGGPFAPVKKAAPDAFLPADVDKNVFKAEVLIMLPLQVRGLEPVYDAAARAWLFYPDRAVSRKELAFIVEDVLMKLTGDAGMASRYLGSRASPFPDVDPAAPWFNACMTAASRNIMQPELSGAFRPDDAVDGAELICAVVRLRNSMTIN